MSNTQERTVQVIQPTAPHTSAAEKQENSKKRRVAAYARVSTDEEEQQTSYENQVHYYTRYIQSHPDWEFAGIYSDEGISGLNTKHREGFNHMISDALSGKIDLILTKSISRFARNTVDSLSTIRKLKAAGVEVYFEKENIFTFDSKGELMITIMSSIAQEESRSISENVTWGKRKNMARGSVSMNYGIFLGYRRGKDGQPEIDPEQAEIVRRIYSLYLEGKSVSAISRILTADGVPTPTGRRTAWSTTTIMSILRNERYKGDALLQKFYTADFLNKKMKKNNGVLPQYYVKNSHPAIIDEETFDRVQQELARRGRGRRGPKHNSPFTGKLICADCGTPYHRVLWFSDPSGQVYVWRCAHKYQGEETCQTPPVREEDIKAAFLKVCTVMAGNLPGSEQTEAGKAVTPVTDFSDEAFTELVRQITVQRDGTLLFRLKDDSLFPVAAVEHKK